MRDLADPRSKPIVTSRSLSKAKHGSERGLEGVKRLAAWLGKPDAWKDSRKLFQLCEANRKARGRQ